MERIPSESRFVCRVTGAGGSSRYWVICWNSHLFLGKGFLGFPRDLAWAGCWWHLLSFGTQQREETLPAHWLWCQSRTSSANAVLLSVETISYPFVWLCVDLVPISPKNMQVLSAKLPVCSQFCRIFLFSLFPFFLPIFSSLPLFPFFIFFSPFFLPRSSFFSVLKKSYCLFQITFETWYFSEMTLHPIFSGLTLAKCKKEAVSFQFFLNLGLYHNSQWLDTILQHYRKAKIRDTSLPLVAELVISWVSCWGMWMSILLLKWQRGGPPLILWGAPHLVYVSYWVLLIQLANPAIHPKHFQTFYKSQLPHWVTKKAWSLACVKWQKFGSWTRGRDRRKNYNSWFFQQWGNINLS